MGCDTRIKEVRNHLKLSQASFGQRIGASRDAINNAENGRAEASDLLLLAICREFNVNEVWLRTGEGEMFRKLDPNDEMMALAADLLKDESDSFRRRFVRLMLNLNEDDWKHLERYARILLAAAPDDEPAPKTGENAKKGEPT